MPLERREGNKRRGMVWYGLQVTRTRPKSIQTDLPDGVRRRERWAEPVGVHLDVPIYRQAVLRRAPSMRLF